MLKVLIAEDSVLLADILEDFLNSRGYDVCGTARTVEEAVWLADHCKPDLAVLDFRLADEDYGSDIRPRLKDQETMGILFVSGDSLKDQLTNVDGDAYLQKPYTMHELLRALHIVHEVKENNQVLASSFPKGFHLLKRPPGRNRQAA